jgi:hypothetical protein
MPLKANIEKFFDALEKVEPERFFPKEIGVG